MKIKTTLVLLTLMCILGFFVYSSYHDSKRTFSAASILKLRAEDVTFLAVQKGKMRLELTKSDGKWRFSFPVEASASDGEVDRFVSSLEFMQRECVITPAQRNRRQVSLDDYGLSNPDFSITVGTGSERQQLFVGTNAPIGDDIYVKLSDRKDVFATSKHVFNLVPENIEVWRDPIALRGESADTARIEIRSQQGGFVQLKRVEDGWVIEQPLRARADSVKVAALLDALYRLKIDKFEWDAPVASPNADTGPVALAQDIGAVMESYGLSREQASVIITVWSRGETSRTLMLGKPVVGDNAGMYAREGRTDSVFVISREALNTFSISINELRDKRIFIIDPNQVKYACFRQNGHKLVLEWDELEGWKITEPVQCRADNAAVGAAITFLADMRAVSFVDNVSTTNLPGMGLDSPGYSIQILANKPVISGESGSPADPSVHRKLLVSKRPGKDGKIFAIFEGDTVASELSPDLLKNLNAVADVLSYRDRTVLAIPSDQVRRIALSLVGKEQAVLRGSDGVWISDQPKEWKVQQQAVDDILMLAACLQAVRVEAHNPQSFKPYGLDKSENVLTIGLRGAEGIQKSVIFGSEAGADGRYVMIQGQDTVFVINKGTASTLLRSPVQDPSVSGKNGK